MTSGCRRCRSCSPALGGAAVVVAAREWIGAMPSLLAQLEAAARTLALAGRENRSRRARRSVAGSASLPASCSGLLAFAAHRLRAAGRLRRRPGPRLAGWASRASPAPLPPPGRAGRARDRHRDRRLGRRRGLAADRPAARRYRPEAAPAPSRWRGSAPTSSSAMSARAGARRACRCGSARSASTRWSRRSSPRSGPAATSRGCCGGTPASASQRQRAEKEARSATAQARMTGGMVVAMPLIMGCSSR